MDPQEFTTIDEVGEDDVRKILFRQKPTAVAEEIDYINKVLCDLQKEKEAVQMDQVINEKNSTESDPISEAQSSKMTDLHGQDELIENLINDDFNITPEISSLISDEALNSIDSSCLEDECRAQQLELPVTHDLDSVSDDIKESLCIPKPSLANEILIKNLPSDSRSAENSDCETSLESKEINSKPPLRIRNLDDLTSPCVGDAEEIASTEEICASEIQSNCDDNQEILNVEADDESSFNFGNASQINFSEDIVCGDDITVPGDDNLSESPSKDTPFDEIILPSMALSADSLSIRECDIIRVDEQNGLNDLNSCQSTPEIESDNEIVLNAVSVLNEPREDLNDSSCDEPLGEENSNHEGKIDEQNSSFSNIETSEENSFPATNICSVSRCDADSICSTASSFLSIPISLSTIKSEPANLDDFDENMNDPAEDLNLEAISSIKEEMPNLKEEYVDFDQCSTAGEDINLADIYKTEYNNTPVCLPNIQYKIKKGVTYGKEEVTAALWMSGPSLARIIEMSMFSNLKKSFPIIYLVRLEALSDLIYLVPHFDRVNLERFFEKYGTNVKKWVKHFKIDTSKKKSVKRKEKEVTKNISKKLEKVQVKKQEQPLNTKGGYSNAIDHKREKKILQSIKKRDESLKVLESIISTANATSENDSNDEGFSGFDGETKECTMLNSYLCDLKAANASYKKKKLSKRKASTIKDTVNLIPCSVKLKRLSHIDLQLYKINFLSSLHPLHVNSTSSELKEIDCKENYSDILASRVKAEGNKLTIKEAHDKTDNSEECKVDKMKKKEKSFFISDHIKKSTKSSDSEKTKEREFPKEECTKNKLNRHKENSRKICKTETAASDKILMREADADLDQRSSEADFHYKVKEDMVTEKGEDHFSNIVISEFVPAELVTPTKAETSAPLINENKSRDEKLGTDLYSVGFGSSEVKSNNNAFDDLFSITATGGGKEKSLNKASVSDVCDNSSNSSLFSVMPPGNDSDSDSCDTSFVLPTDVHEFMQQIESPPKRIHNKFNSIQCETNDKNTGSSIILKSPIKECVGNTERTKEKELNLLDEDKKSDSLISSKASNVSHYRTLKTCCVKLKDILKDRKYKDNLKKEFKIIYGPKYKEFFYKNRKHLEEKKMSSLEPKKLQIAPIEEKTLKKNKLFSEEVKAKEKQKLKLHKERLQTQVKEKKRKHDKMYEIGLKKSSDAAPVPIKEPKQTVNVSEMFPTFGSAFRIPKKNSQKTSLPMKSPTSLIDRKDGKVPTTYGEYRRRKLGTDFSREPFRKSNQRDNEGAPISERREKRIKIHEDEQQNVAPKPFIQNINPKHAVTCRNIFPSVDTDEPEPVEVETDIFDSHDYADDDPIETVSTQKTQLIMALNSKILALMADDKKNFDFSTPISSDDGAVEVQSQVSVSESNKENSCIKEDTAENNGHVESHEELANLLNNYYSSDEDDHKDDTSDPQKKIEATNEDTTSQLITDTIASVPAKNNLNVIHNQRKQNDCDKNRFSDSEIEKIDEAFASIPKKEQYRLYDRYKAAYTKAKLKYERDKSEFSKSSSKVMKYRDMSKKRKMYYKLKFYLIEKKSKTALQVPKVEENDNAVSPYSPSSSPVHTSHIQKDKTEHLENENEEQPSLNDGDNILSNLKKSDEAAEDKEDGEDCLLYSPSLPTFADDDNEAALSNHCDENSPGAKNEVDGSSNSDSEGHESNDSLTSSPSGSPIIIDEVQGSFLNNDVLKGSIIELIQESSSKAAAMPLEMTTAVTTANSNSVTLSVSCHVTTPIVSTTDAFFSSSNVPNMATIRTTETSLSATSSKSVLVGPNVLFPGAVLSNSQVPSTSRQPNLMHTLPGVTPSISTNLSLATALMLPPPPPPPSNLLNTSKYAQNSNEKNDKSMSQLMSEFFVNWKNPNSRDDFEVVFSQVRNKSKRKSLRIVEEGYFYKETPLAQTQLDKVVNAPLVGLQYILEVQKDSDASPTNCSYICCLCSKKMSLATLAAHVKSVPHRLKYTDRHSPEIFARFGKLELKQWTAALVKEFTAALQEIEAAIGRERIAVAKEHEISAAVACLKRKLEQPPDVVERQTNNKTAINVDSPKPLNNTNSHEETKLVDLTISPKPEKEKRDSPAIQAMRARSSQDSLAPPKRSLSPHLSQSFKSNLPPVKTRRDSPPRGNRTSPFSSQRRRLPTPPRDRRSPPRPRWIEREKKHGSYRDSPIDDERWKDPLLREKRKSRSRSPVHSKKRSRSRSPKRSYSQKSTTNDDKKLKDFRIDENRLRSQHFQSMDKYLHEPESHPRYNPEWVKFWESRFRELDKQGSDPSSHDYKSDWIKFWPIKLKEICHIEYEKKRSDLLSRCRLDDPDSKPNEKDVRRSSDKNKDRARQDNKQPFRKVSSPGENRYKSFGKPEAEKSASVLDMISRISDNNQSRDRRERSLSPWEREVKNPPISSKNETQKQKVVYEMEFSAVGTLKLLNDLEDQLGSFGPSVNNLLTKAIELTEKGAKPIELFSNKDNLVLLKLSNEKLSSQVSSGILGAMMAAKTQMAIESASWLQREAEKQYPAVATRILDLDINNISTATYGMDTIQVAQYIAQQLLNIGKSDCGEDDLHKILLAVSANHAKYKFDSAASSSSQIANIFDAPASSAFINTSDSNSRPALFPSGTQGLVVPAGPSNAIANTTASSANVTPTSTLNNAKTVTADQSASSGLSMLQSAYEDKTKDMDKLSLEDLQELLSSFTTLNSQEQQTLTAYLKKLEATDSKKVTKLRAMMYQSSNKMKQKPKTTPRERSATAALAPPPFPQTSIAPTITTVAPVPPPEPVQPTVYPVSNKTPAFQPPQQQGMMEALSEMNAKDFSFVSSNNEPTAYLNPTVDSGYPNDYIPDSGNSFRPVASWEDNENLSSGMDFEKASYPEDRSQEIPASSYGMRDSGGSFARPLRFNEPRAVEHDGLRASEPFDNRNKLQENFGPGNAFGRVDSHGDFMQRRPESERFEEERLDLQSDYQRFPGHNPDSSTRGEATHGQSSNINDFPPPNSSFGYRPQPDRSKDAAYNEDITHNFGPPHRHEMGGFKRSEDYEQMEPDNPGIGQPFPGRRPFSNPPEQMGFSHSRGAHAHFGREGIAESRAGGAFEEPEQESYNQNSSMSQIHPPQPQENADCVGGFEHEQGGFEEDRDSFSWKPPSSDRGMHSRGSDRGMRSRGSRPPRFPSRRPRGRGPRSGSLTHFPRGRYSWGH